ncbi:ASCL4 protein, partial [Origma solitaria]|nr:ASCL4 protein [Origma solitaria]
LMASNKDYDKLLKRIAFPGAVSLASTHHHGAPRTEPFGVPFPLDPSCWQHARSGHAGGISSMAFPGCVGLCECSLEPAFVRRRNERERLRVRCVNAGYARLRQHLPRGTARGRLSKVQTLRAAIGYIKHLQALLERQPSGSDSEGALRAGEGAGDALRECSSDGESRASPASSPCSEAGEMGT